jgi:iron complex transport system permease protein
MKKRLNWKKLLIFLGVASAFSIVACIGFGPASVSPIEVMKILLSRAPFFGDNIAHDWTELQESVILTVRLPRVFLGFVVGCSLAFSGTSMQTLVKNELADPYILGVSYGAAAFATIGIVTGLFSFMGVYQNAVNGLIGAIISLVFVFVFSLNNGKVNVYHLLLGGVAIGMFTKAIVKMVAMMYPQAFTHSNSAFWTQGGLAGARWAYLQWPLLLTIVCIVFLFIRYRELNAFLLGEETAHTLGIVVPRMEKFLILTTAVMIGITVSVSGGIGFIGLVAPHIARMLVGGDHKRVFPVSALLGGLFVLWCDVVARMLMAPQEIPVGIFTALIGGPFFIYLLKRKESYGK